MKLLEKLEDKLSKIFKPIWIGEDYCFELPNGMIAHLIAFKEWKCILVEYAENVDAYKKYQSEEGEQFYFEEMTEDELFEAIKSEMVSEQIRGSEN